MNTSKPLNGRVLISDGLGRDSFNTQLLYFTCSSLSADDERIYLISDRDGHPNVWMHDMFRGTDRKLTDNQKGILKSYVYFDGTQDEGLGKASVCLDYIRERIYYIQDDKICRSDRDGNIRVLNRVPDGRMTAFTHVSLDGTKLCVPMTDGRILDFDPETEGEGLDKRPKYNIDQRAQDEGLNSYLCVYDTESGALLYEKTIPRCWITHVQFHPLDSDIIMYNHEWSAFDCGIRRVNIYDHRQDIFYHVRTEGDDTKGNSRGYARSRNDWVCHEMWTDDGRSIIYHGGYDHGPAMVGRCDIDFTHTDANGLPARTFWEIALPDEYNAYGHFLMDHRGNLTCDGYYRMPGKKSSSARIRPTTARIRIERMAHISRRSSRTGMRASSTGFHSVSMTLTGSARTRIRTRSTPTLATASSSTAAWRIRSMSTPSRHARRRKFARCEITT